MGRECLSLSPLLEGRHEVPWGCCLHLYIVFYSDDGVVEANVFPEAIPDGLCET